MRDARGERVRQVRVALVHQVLSVPPVRFLSVALDGHAAGDAEETHGVC